MKKTIIAVVLCASLGACAQADWDQTVWAHAGIANPIPTQADKDAAAAKQVQYLESLRAENAAEQAQRDAEAKRQADAAARAAQRRANPTDTCINLEGESGMFMHFREGAAHGVPLWLAFQPYRDDPVTMDIITIAYRVQVGSMPASQGIDEASKVCKRAEHHAQGAAK